MNSKKIITDPPIFPKNLSSEALSNLCDTLYAVHSQIFDGVDQAGFCRYVLCPDNYLTKLFLFRNIEGEVVGYLTFQVYRMEENGRSAYLYRTETGLLRAYRGQAPIARLLIPEIWKFWLSHSFPRGYFVATPIHPVPYVVADRTIAELYPRPGQVLGTRKSEKMARIAAALDLKAGQGPGRFLAKVGWQVRMDARNQRKLARSKSVACRYYLEENPGFTEGSGLLIVAPATLSNGIRTAWRSFRRSFHGFRRLQPIRIRIARPFGLVLK